MYKMQCHPMFWSVYVSLVLMTAGFVLTLCSWLTPALNYLVETSRVLGLGLLAVGSLILAITCVVGALFQGRCCPICYACNRKRHIKGEFLMKSIENPFLATALVGSTLCTQEEERKVAKEATEKQSMFSEEPIPYDDPPSSTLLFENYDALRSSNMDSLVHINSYMYHIVPQIGDEGDSPDADMHWESESCFIEAMHTSKETACQKESSSTEKSNGKMQEKQLPTGSPPLSRKQGGVGLRPSQEDYNKCQAKSTACNNSNNKSKGISYEDQITNVSPNKVKFNKQRPTRCSSQPSEKPVSGHAETPSSARATDIFPPPPTYKELSSCEKQAKQSHVTQHSRDREEERDLRYSPMSVMAPKETIDTAIDSPKSTAKRNVGLHEPCNAVRVHDQDKYKVPSNRKENGTNNTASALMERKPTCHGKTRSVEIKVYETFPTVFPSMSSS